MIPEGAPYFPRTSESLTSNLTFVHQLPPEREREAARRFAADRSLARVISRLDASTAPVEIITPATLFGEPAHRVITPPTSTSALFDYSLYRALLLSAIRRLMGSVNPYACHRTSLTAQPVLIVWSSGLVLIADTAAASVSVAEALCVGVRRTSR